MALALSLPFNFPDREAFIITTFGVVLFTLLVQGLTIEPLVKFLGIRPANPKFKQYQALKSRLIAESQAFTELKNLRKLGHVSPSIFQELENEIIETQRVLQNQIEDLHLEDASVKELELESARLHILDVRKDAIKSLVREGTISHELAEKIQADLDGKMFEIVAQEEEHLNELESAAAAKREEIGKETQQKPEVEETKVES